MRSVFASALAALALVACGNVDTTPPPMTSQDAGTDTAVTADAATPDAVTPPVATYPAAPYGSRVCARFEPFTLNRCNGEPWSFAQNNWSESPLTVVIISAVWCVPCQREAAVLERELVQPYADRNVRVVTILVQNSDRTAITATQCTNNWENRYRLTIPVLMDPQQSLSPFYPGLAFPGNLIIDRQGRIRWRQYGTEMSLNSIKTAIDEVLANPNTCTP